MTEREHASEGVETRPLDGSDLDAVTALDRELAGRSRRGYFERRRAAAVRDPKSHLQIAAAGPSGLVGFMLARITSGEFGRTAPTVLLESMGVSPSQQHAGLGQRMLSVLETRAAAQRVTTVVTQVDWRHHSMLRFLDGTGFSLAPRLLLDRSLARLPDPKADEDLEALAVHVRALRATDFDRVVHVDRRITGRDRSGYFRRKFDEALHESAVRVSLVAEDDGFVVGFAMARVDIGDFGHAEPTAALDTLGVDPDFRGKGFARQLLGQMLDNLAALRATAIETEVAHDHLDLVRFFHAFGFTPSQRLVFQAHRRRG